jgi:hypothetical protein
VFEFGVGENSNPTYIQEISSPEPLASGGPTVFPDTEHKPNTNYGILRAP